MCLCDQGWEAHDCSVPYCVGGCGENEYCAGPNVCQCRDGYSGSSCELCDGCSELSEFSHLCVDYNLFAAVTKWLILVDMAIIGLLLYIGLLFPADFCWDRKLSEMGLVAARNTLIVSTSLICMFPHQFVV